MAKIGFDNEAYLEKQSENIINRLNKFGGKLYLEFGGKLFDDYHAARVLTGFEPDSKIKMLAKVKDEAEIVIAINAGDIEKNKVEDFIKKTDKRRASYYNYYTDMKWGEARHFDLCINSSRSGIEGAVDLMYDYVGIKENKPAG